MLRMKHFLNKIVEKIEKHFTFGNFFSENCVAFELTSKNMVEPEKPQITIQYGACALHAG